MNFVGDASGLTVMMLGSLVGGWSASVVALIYIGIWSIFETTIIQ